MLRNPLFAVAFALATALSSHSTLSAQRTDQALLQALGSANMTLVQGIAQVAKGTEVPTEAKYEMENGKLMMSVYTSAKGFAIVAEDNSFIEYKGAATTGAWAPKKEVFADFKHIARAAQYHALLSMTKVTIPEIIRRASAQGTVFSVKEKIRNGEPVFEVKTVKGSTAKTNFYNLVTGNPVSG